jgi:hypothetical protein
VHTSGDRTLRGGPAASPERSGSTRIIFAGKFGALGVASAQAEPLQRFASSAAGVYGVTFLRSWVGLVGGVAPSFAADGCNLSISSCQSYISPPS